MGFVVAVDGTAGSGKGTVTKKIAEAIGFINIDTGAMYRCIAWEAIQKNIALNEEGKLIALTDKLEIELTSEGKVYLNEKEVTEEIRSKDVTAIVSQVSSIPAIREKMVDMQRKMAQGKDIIMEGRDIGTVVFPHADIKIYLDADVEERAKRRQKENEAKGIQTSYEEVLANVKMRDENDKNKKVGALKVAEDAIIIDTTHLSIEEVTEKIKELISAKYQGGKHA